MKVKDLVRYLKQMDQEAVLSFSAYTETGTGDVTLLTDDFEFCNQQDTGNVQIVLSGEARNGSTTTSS